jgi:hypothetical protein
MGRPSGGVQMPARLENALLLDVDAKLIDEPKRGGLRWRLWAVCTENLIRVDDAMESPKLVADRIHKPQSFVAKYEGGERRIDVVEFLVICQAIGADSAKLLKALKNAVGTDA